MNRRLLTVAAVGVAAAFGLVMPLRALPPGTHFNKSTDTTKHCTGGDLTIHAPATLWPPNHKYDTDIYVLAVDKDPTAPLTLESDGHHNQYDGDTEVNGSGHTADDITSNDGTATVTKKASADAGNDGNYPEVVAMENGTGTVHTDWEARAERSGQLQDGRTYTLSASVKFSDGTTCTESVDFTVPHDMRKSNR